MQFHIEIYRKDEISVSSDLITKAWGTGSLAMTFSPEFVKFLWTIPNVDPDLLLCARFGEKVVGQVFTLPRTVKLKNHEYQFKVGGVALVAVHPDFRRKGIAKSLMSKTIEIAKEKGFDALTLFTGPQSPQLLSDTYPARELYEKLGFKTFYKSTLKMKVLDPWYLAKAINRPYLAPLMWLKANVREIPLPDGFMIREYEQKDRSSCIDLVKEHVKQFDYVELVHANFWSWWHESMPESMNPKTLLLEKNRELIGSIEFYTSDMKAKRKSEEKHLIIGNIGSLHYKRGFEQQVQELIIRVLHELKHLDSSAAMYMFSPNAFKPTPFLKKIWGKQGFMNLRGVVQRFMYKPLNPKFSNIEDFNTFYIQPL